MNSPDSIDRRSALQTLALVGAGAACLPQSATGAAAQTVAAPSNTATAGLRPLPFNPARLNGLSEKLIRSHWENNYGGSVRTLAAVKKKLAEAMADESTPAWLYNGIKREHLLRTGSVVYHEHYFENLGGSGLPGASLRTALGAAFGTYDLWESEFRRIATGLGGGSGWVMLGFNTHVGQLENYWLSDHAHGPAATLPLLVLDMYEHSYQMDFGAATARYIDAFFTNIQWDTVQARLERVRKTVAT